MAEAAESDSATACRAGQTALAARLHVRLSTVCAAGGNLVFSPLSIHVALALMSAGSSGGTLAEILRVAGAPSRGDLDAFVRDEVVGRALADRSGRGGPRVAFACGAWTDRRWPVKQAYRDTVARTYRADAWTVDFRNNPVEARKQINGWVAKVTRNLITDVLQPNRQSKNTVMVAANAIYFKGEWIAPFAMEDTKDCKFYRIDGSSISVPFMQSQRWQYVACHPGFKVLKLPYKVADNGSLECDDQERWKSLPKFTMCVFLPDNRDGLRGMVEKITASPEFVRGHLPTTLVPVSTFRLPRFKLCFQSSIVGAFKNLGLRLPFDPYEANMTEMVNAPLYVEEVIHKAVIVVNEEGSEAVACTDSDDGMGFSLDDGVPPPKPVDFVADHPFAFFIIEETLGTIVFSGHLLDPSKEE